MVEDDGVREPGSLLELVAQVLKPQILDEHGLSVSWGCLSHEMDWDPLLCRAGQTSLQGDRHCTLV
jgi:hypothetical protein